MIKCHIDRKINRFKVAAKGDGLTISTDTLGILKMIFTELSKQSPEAADAFKKTIIAGVLDPRCHVWEVFDGT